MGKGRESRAVGKTGKARFNVCSCACLGLANLLLPMVFAMQMGTLDLLMYHDEDQSLPLYALVLFFVLPEVALLMHMVLHWGPAQVVRSGSLQWIVYSWLISAKCGVLYFRVLPHQDCEALLEQVSQVRRVLYLSPVFYSILTFRTCVHVFRGSEGSSNRSKTWKEWSEHGTLDIILLQDMVWHVFIDFLDVMTMCINMVTYGAPCNTQNSIQQDVVSISGDAVNACGAAAGIFMILSLFFHQQSFPSITRAMNSASTLSNPPLMRDQSQVRPTISDLSQRSGELLNSSLSRMDSFKPSVSSFAGAATMKAANQQVSDSLKSGDARGEEHRVEVVKARKRSAIISILLVDLPFLAIRGSMYVLELNAAHARHGADLGTDDSPLRLTPLTWASNSSTNVYQEFGSTKCIPNSTNSELRNAELASSQLEPMIQSMMLKNFFCILLQAMMLRFVQQADLERAQKIKWMDVYQSEAFASRSVAAHRSKENRRHNPFLQKLWDEKDLQRNKLEAALEDCGGYSDSECTTEFTDSATEPEVESPSGSAVSSLDRAGLSPTSLLGVGRRSWSSLFRRCCFCCCCCRRRVSSDSSRRWPCGGLTHACKQTLLHVIMGFVLGWLLNQINFQEMFRSLTKKTCS